MDGKNITVYGYKFGDEIGFISYYNNNECVSEFGRIKLLSIIKVIHNAK